MELKVILVLLFVTFSYVNCSRESGTKRNEAIDSSYLEDVLDAQECHRQIRAIRRSAMLLLQFTDAGIRTPRGVLTGNAVDLGNYHQCLGIDHELEEMHIQGKYCSIYVPFNQSFELPRPQDMISSQFNPTSLRLDNETISKIEEYNLRRRQLLALSGDFDGFDPDTRSIPNNPLASTVFRLGVCVPKPCTTQQAISSFFFNISAVGFQYADHYCRLPDDKPWVPADYVAVVVFSLIGILTLISTVYDVSCRFLFKKDVKQMSTLYRSFSVYTNGQRLTTFSSGSGNLQCLDGIRTLAMMWVIVGHSFSTEPFLANPLDSRLWMFSASALWITAATMTVDTFFTLAGVLLVYTTAGKMNQITFIKNLHWFYFNRFMRVTPMLAVTILLQATYYNRMFDGPYWVTVADHTERCRNTWWATLLHIQNYVNPRNMCVTHSWYVAIDFQLYLLSPLVLYWVLTGKKLLAWIGLLGGLASVLIASTIYNFQKNFAAGTLVPSRFLDSLDYMAQYYFNTLTRASPFFVGLIFGYLLHINRKKRIRMPWPIVMLCWACSAGIFGGILYFKYRIKQFEWDNQLADNMMNSFMRPSFACAICWLVVACVHGYAGPVNWFLTLDVWWLPARLTYGMFLFHYPLMYAFNSTTVAPVYFTVEYFTFKFLSYLVLSVVYSFIFTLLVDSPVTVLFKQLMDLAIKKKPAVTSKGATKEEENGTFSGEDRKMNTAHSFPNKDNPESSNANSAMHVNSIDLTTESNGFKVDPDIHADSNVINDTSDVNIDRNVVPSNNSDIPVHSDVTEVAETK